MSAFNWFAIRSYNGSQNNAFEELVCQLAREEYIPNKAKFIRVGAPDGGVEAYCQLDNGEEYGWQAKYFSSMSNSQWQQLEESLKTALKKHPNLSKYYVCIPLDRQDPRSDNQRWFMDKWNEHVEKWERIAFETYNIKIAFEYWGSSELISRLSQEKHIGTRKFWFEGSDISEKWLSDKLNESIISLGKRYTPKLNLQLEIANTFSGLVRDRVFWDNLLQSHRDMEYKVINALKVLEGCPIAFSELIGRIQQHNSEIKRLIEDMQQPYNEMCPVDFNQLDSKCTALGISLMECIQELEKSKQEELKSNKEQNGNNTERQKFDSKIRNLMECRYPISDFQEFLQSSSSKMVNSAAMILVGEPGIGKSHLLADIANKLNGEGKPVILLLGQHFTNDDSPWRQILKNQLRINMTDEELLGTLNAKAQSIQCKMLIIVDAINEGRGIFFWKDQIRAFIHSIKKYKWLSLALSVRTSYEKILIPEEVYDNQEAIRVKHNGFLNVEHEASKLFFENYNIIQPSVPLLHPEFQNPLFLKLFCEGLNKAGKTVIPDGLEGITKIIDFYLVTINNILSAPTRLNYSNKLNLVQKAIHAVVSQQVEKQCQYILYDEANVLVGQEVQQHTNEWRRFLDELVKEGVFSLDIFWTSPTDKAEGVYFAYERFGDHIAVSYMLNQFLDKDNPYKAFQEGVLHKYVENESSCDRNRGVIEALSIQLPEFLGKELYEVAPFCAYYGTVAEAFIKSLLWRNTDTINRKVYPYIKKIVKQNDWYERLFLDTVLQVSSNPRHFFNADRLHRHLMKLSLPKRDAWWTLYVNKNFYEQTAIKRLIDWAWTNNNRDYCTDEAIRLLAQTVSWFLTSTNRKLRDSATKALVCLLQDRIQVMEGILRTFEGVNDPYVYERLFAVAYGCAVRTTQKQKLPKLCQYIYDIVFSKQFVYPHILLRDYARNIIEYTVYLGLTIDIDLEKVRPPYRSDWYKNIPSTEEIDRQFKYDYEEPGFKRIYWAQNNILNSMTTEYGRGTGGYGDFGRYVFQAAVNNWGKDFKPQVLSNIATQRVFELGYDVELHGDYDINKKTSLDRHDHNVERIGKKYQWIAFHEILAKLSDNFKMSEVDYSNSGTLQYGDIEFDLKAWLAAIGESSEDEEETTIKLSPFSTGKVATERKYISIDYEGPWNPFVRDIDPTVIISRLDKKINYFDDKYEIPKTNIAEWVHDFNPIPWLEDVLFLNKNSREFVMLSSHLTWEINKEVNENFYDSDHVFIKTTGFLVPKDKIAEYACSKKINKYSYNSEWGSAYNVFGKEYYWSPSAKECEMDLSEQENEIKTTTFVYIWGKGYDNSIEDSISYLMPSEYIVGGLGLSQDNNGYWIDSEFKVVCYDMAIEGYDTALLIERATLEKLLKDQKLALIWDVFLEKIGGKELHKWRFVLVLQNDKLQIVDKYEDDTWPVGK